MYCPFKMSNPALVMTSMNNKQVCRVISRSWDCEKEECAAWDWERGRCSLVGDIREK